MLPVQPLYPAHNSFFRKWKFLAGLLLFRRCVVSIWFRRRLNENAGLTEEDFKAKVWIDVPMPVGYVTERLVRELSCLEPFGQGNEKPLFAEKSLRIRASRVLGRNRNVVKMTLEETDGHAIEALYFGDGTAFEEERAGRREIDVVYYPDINEYNGRKTLQAVIRRYKFRG